MDHLYSKILADAKQKVTSLLVNQLDTEFVFHNLNHTTQVVHSAEKIADYYHLKDEDQCIVCVSAWFHDAGFITGRSEGHEDESIWLANNFLQQRCNHNTLQKILSCIQVTRLPQLPLTLVEQIICDADLFHLGTDQFETQSLLLKKEWEYYHQTNYSKIEWADINMKFLESHQYFTSYCQARLEPIKQRWLAKLKSDVKAINFDDF